MAVMTMSVDTCTLSLAAGLDGPRHGLCTRAVLAALRGLECCQAHTPPYESSKRCFCGQQAVEGAAVTSRMSSSLLRRVRPKFKQAST